MATDPKFSQVAAQAALDALLAKLNVGGIAGTIKIYSGSEPITLETAASGTLLSSGLTFSTTAFAASVATGGGTQGATATANAITSDTNAANSGTAGYFRACDHTGLAVLQGNVGTSAADMILNTTTITAGDTIAITAFTAFLPNGGT
jgi:hypothetical protein